MTTTSSPKVAIASVLGTITTAAQSVSSVFDGIASGIGMANRAIQTASEKQIIATDYSMADYEDNLLNSLAVERTRMNREITMFLDADPANRAEYADVRASLEEKVAARRAARSGARSPFGTFTPAAAPTSIPVPQAAPQTA